MFGKKSRWAGNILAAREQMLRQEEIKLEKKKRDLEAGLVPPPPPPAPPAPPAPTTVIVNGGGEAIAGRSLASRVARGVYRRVSHLLAEVASLAGTAAVVAFGYLVASRASGGFHHALALKDLGPSVSWAFQTLISAARSYVRL